MSARAKDREGSVKGRVAVLCRPETAGGFELAGLRPVIADSPGEAADRLEELGASPGTAVLLVEARLWRRVDDRLRTRLASSPAPLVLSFPGPTREKVPSDEEALRELLGRAVGYRVRLG